MRVGPIDAADTRELRRRVLRPNLTLDDVLPGDDLPEAVHFGVVDGDGTVIGACFVRPEDCPWRSDGAGAWRLRQMATATERQGRGIGSLLLAGVFGELRARDVPLVWCHAREQAIPFYERNGFHGHGELFLEYPDPQQPIPHWRMWRELSGTPTSSG